MGVIVKIARPYRCCNSCNSNDGVVEITALMRVGKTEQGSQIALCESCAQMLRFALNSRYKGYGEQDGRIRGRWIEHDDGLVACECSVCHEKYDLYEEDVFGRNFCPNCGADMEVTK